MHKLITNIWDKAVAENKLDEAETAMEVLNVMSYGLLDSRTMNAVNQMDFTIAGDSGLSWNKNPAIAKITGGFDTLLKWTVMGTGYAVTAGVNAVRRIGTGVRKSDKKEYLKNNSELAEERKNLDAQNAKDDAAIEKLKQQQDGLDATSQEYQDLQDQIDFYNTSKSDRTAEFDAKDAKTKESYARLMAFWKLLRTGHTKTFFRISKKRVERKMHEQNDKHTDGKMHDLLKSYKDNYMDYAA